MSAPAPSLYIVYGDDEIGIRQTMDKLVGELCAPGAAAFDLVRLEGAALTLENLQNAVLSLPFMGGKRVVVAMSPLSRLAGKASGSPRSAGKNDEQDGQSNEDGAQDAAQDASERRSSVQLTRKTLTAIMENLPPSTALILVEAQPQWLLAWAKDREGVQVTAHVVGAGGMARWISQRARKLDGAISPAAAAALAYKAGADTRIAMNEIDKLLAYVNYKRTIEQDDVELVSADSGEASIFNYVDALSQRNASQALKLLRRLLEEQEPMYILVMVIRQFRLLLLGRYLLDARSTLDEALKAFDTRSEWLAKKILDQARRFSLPELEMVYRRMLDLDSAIKVGEVDTDVALESFSAAFTSLPVHSER